MAEQGYFGEQPRFQRKDTLTTWSYIFLASGIIAAVWVLLLMFLMSRDLLGSRDSALGLEQETWVWVATVALVACVIGLFFVIVARIGGTQAGSYISADLEAERARRRAEDETGEPAATAALQAQTVEAKPHEVVPTGRDAARIEDPFGPGGRMLLSYTFPEEQPRGIYGDTYVRVDTDSVLNVKTLLAKTLRGPMIRR